MRVLLLAYAVSGLIGLALALNPRFYDAHVLMAQILERRGRPQEARAQAAAAMELKPMVSLPIGTTAAPGR
jgi:hypothetical protein